MTPAGSTTRSASEIDGASILVVSSAPALAARIAGEARRRGADVVLASPAPLDDVPSLDGIVNVPRAPTSEEEADHIVDLALETLHGLNAVIAVIGAGSLRAMHETGLDAWMVDVVQPMRVAFWLARRSAHEFVMGAAGGRLVFVVESQSIGAGEHDNLVVEQAMVSFARSIAKEYGRRGVASNVVLTDGKPGRSQSTIVETTLFLASSAASFVTGECITVQSNEGLRLSS